MQYVAKITHNIDSSLSYCGVDYVLLFGFSITDICLVLLWGLSAEKVILVIHILFQK
jgi:hypothetical protein